MTERESSTDYDEALARVRTSQQKLVRALTQHLPAGDRVDAVNATRQLLHDMDGLYMTTFSRMIDQINSMHDQRWSDLDHEMKAIGARQGRHAGIIAKHDTRLDRIEAALEFEPES